MEGGTRRKRLTFKPTWKDVGITLGTLTATTLICFVLKPLAGEERIEAALFVVAVLIISRFTSGYLYGVAASILGVLIVNCIFTYPFYKLNFTLAGYPIAFLSMLVAAIITSTLTTRIKEQEQLKIEAERERTRSNLLRAVSHDLRTPLTAISGACSVLRDEGDNISEVEKKKLVSQIDEDATWLIRLVENLLIVTRIDSPSGADISKEYEAAEEVTGSAIALFRKNYQNVRVEASVPEEVLMVPMDGMLIRQVLLNLLENAAIHAEGMTKVCINVKRSDNKAVFSVSDDGKGIEPAVLSSILAGDFQKSLGKSDDKKRNMGIGLSVCSTIIAAHNGSINAYNATGGGAVFEFALPLGDEEQTLFYEKGQEEE